MRCSRRGWLADLADVHVVAVGPASSGRMSPGASTPAPWPPLPPRPGRSSPICDLVDRSRLSRRWFTRQVILTGLTESHLRMEAV